MRCLQDFASKELLAASQAIAIGALSSAKLAFFDWESKQYQPIPVGNFRLGIDCAGLIDKVSSPGSQLGFLELVATKRLDRSFLSQA